MYPRQLRDTPLESIWTSTRRIKMTRMTCCRLPSRHLQLSVLKAKRTKLMISNKSLTLSEILMVLPMPSVQCPIINYHLKQMFKEMWNLTIRLLTKTSKEYLGPCMSSLEETPRWICLWRTSWRVSWTMLNSPATIDSSSTQLRWSCLRRSWSTSSGGKWMARNSTLEDQCLKSMRILESRMKFLTKLAWSLKNRLGIWRHGIPSSKSSSDVLVDSDHRLCSQRRSLKL